MEYRFAVGDQVRVSANKRDPGGTGRVTGQQQTTDKKGTRNKYRVYIDNEKQNEMRRQDRARDGFWYSETRCEAA